MCDTLGYLFLPRNGRCAEVPGISQQSPSLRASSVVSVLPPVPSPLLTFFQASHSSTNSKRGPALGGGYWGHNNVGLELAQALLPLGQFLARYNRSLFVL